jgi:hypothetical protein
MTTKIGATLLDFRNSNPSELFAVAHEVNQGLHFMHENSHDLSEKLQLANLADLSDHLCDILEGHPELR